MIVPFSHDQPDNAFRLKNLGVAETPNLSRLNPKRLEEKLLLLLHDDNAAARCQDLKMRIQDEDPIGLIVESINAMGKVG